MTQKEAPKFEPLKGKEGWEERPIGKNNSNDEKTPKFGPLAEMEGWEETPAPNIDLLTPRLQKRPGENTPTSFESLAKSFSQPDSQSSQDKNLKIGDAFGGPVEVNNPLTDVDRVIQFQKDIEKGIKEEGAVQLKTGLGEEKADYYTQDLGQNDLPELIDENGETIQTTKDQDTGELGIAMNTLGEQETKNKDFEQLKPGIGEKKEPGRPEISDIELEK